MLRWSRLNKASSVRTRNLSSPTSSCHLSIDFLAYWTVMGHAIVYE